MSGQTLIDAHDKGTLIGNVVITKFFSDCIWIKIHLSHMPNVALTRIPDAACEETATPPGFPKIITIKLCHGNITYE